MTTSDKTKLEDRKKEADKKEKNSFPSKVTIRRLPSSMTETEFLEAVSPLPEHNFLRFVRADRKMGQYAFSRAYINFVNQEDIYPFKEKFDGYVFVDNQGNEYPGLVEFAPNPKVTPVRENRRKDLKMATIEQDPDYLKFLESLEQPAETVSTMEKVLEEIEFNEREKKAGRGLANETTPLLQFIKDKKGDKLKKREEQKETRRKREEDRKKSREDERIKRKEMRERDQREWDRRDRDRTDGRKTDRERESHRERDLKKLEREREIQHEKEVRDKCREKIKELNAEDSKKKNVGVKDEKTAKLQETRVFTNSTISDDGKKDKDVDKENKSDKDRKDIEKEKKLAREEKEKERFRKREEERSKKREQDKEKREKEKERRDREREERRKEKELASVDEKIDKGDGRKDDNRRDQKREDIKKDDKKREDKPEKWTDSNWKELKEVPKETAKANPVEIEEKTETKEDTGAPKTMKYSDRRKEEKARREKEKLDKLKKKDGVEDTITITEGIENMSIESNVDSEYVAEKQETENKEGKKIPDDSAATSGSEKYQKKEDAHKEYKRDREDAPKEYKRGSKYTEEEKQKYREKRREQERPQYTEEEKQKYREERKRPQYTEEEKQKYREERKRPQYTEEEKQKYRERRREQEKERPQYTEEEKQKYREKKREQEKDRPIYTEEEKQKHRENRREQEKERRAAKKIENVRNKERPAAQIYRPGMGKYSSRTIKKEEESDGRSPRASRDSSPKKSSRSGSPEEGKKDVEKKTQYGSRDVREKGRGRGKKYDEYYEEDYGSGKKYGASKGYHGYDENYYYDDQSYKRGRGRGGRGGYRGGYKDDGYYYGSGRGYKEEGYYEKTGKTERKRKSESEGKSSDERSEKEGSIKTDTGAKSTIKEENKAIGKEGHQDKEKEKEGAHAPIQENKADAKEKDGAHAPDQENKPNAKEKEAAPQKVETGVDQGGKPESVKLEKEKPSKVQEKCLETAEKPEASSKRPKDENVITLEGDED